MKGPEDLHAKSKIEKEMYPLLKPVFHLHPFADSKDVQMVVYQYADCSSKESFINKHTPELAGHRCTPQLLTDLTTRVRSQIVSKQCIASTPVHGFVAMTSCWPDV